MNLWIRSQDRLKLNKIEWINYSFYNGNHELYADSFFVGCYSSKERAIEVLDEIQKLLMPQVKVIHNKTEEVKLQDFTSNIIAQPVIEDIQIQQASSYVYEMPKE